jgi:hypothetical protein
MQDCAALLGTLDRSNTLEALDLQYAMYKQHSSGLLSREQHIAMRAARSVPFFLFQHQQTAADILGEQEDTFVRFADAMFPLASRLNARRIHRALVALSKKSKTPLKQVVLLYIQTLRVYYMRE